MSSLNREINKFMQSQVKMGATSNFTINDVYEEFGKDPIDNFIRENNDEPGVELSMSFGEKIYKKIFGVDPPRLTANVLRDLKTSVGSSPLESE